MTTPRKPRQHRPFNHKPIDTEVVLDAWKELPGCRDGLSVIVALQLAKDHPGRCGKLVAILQTIEKRHRARTLEKALERLVMNHKDSDYPYIERDEYIEYRATRKSAAKNLETVHRRKTNEYTLRRSHPTWRYKITSHCP